MQVQRGHLSLGLAVGNRYSSCTTPNSSQVFGEDPGAVILNSQQQAPQPLPTPAPAFAIIWECTSRWKVSVASAFQIKNVFKPWEAKAFMAESSRTSTVHASPAQPVAISTHCGNGTVPSPAAGLPAPQGQDIICNLEAGVLPGQETELHRYDREEASRPMVAAKRAP